MCKNVSWTVHSTHFSFYYYCLKKKKAFLAILGNMWDPSSLSRDWTCAPCIGSSESQPMDHQESSVFSKRAVGENCRSQQYSAVRSQVSQNRATSPLSMRFSRQEYWSGCHALLQGFSPPRDRTSISWVSCIGGGLFTTSDTQEASLPFAQHKEQHCLIINKTIP